MGKRLTNSERWSRERKAADARRERERKSREKKIRREKEVEKQKALKKLEKLRIQRQKENAEKERLKEIQSAVEIYNEFIERLTRPHSKFRPNPKFFDRIIEAELPYGKLLNTYQEPQYLNYEKSIPDPKIAKIGKEAKYTFDEYCKKIHKLERNLEEEIVRLEAQADYTYDEYRILNFKKHSLGWFMATRGKYITFHTNIRSELHKVKKQLLQLQQEYEVFQKTKTQKYNDAVTSFKLTEETKQKEIEEQNLALKNEYETSLRLEEEGKKYRKEWIERLSSGNPEVLAEFMSMIFPLKFDLLEDEHDFLVDHPSDIDVAYQLTGSDSLAFMIELNTDIEFYPEGGVKLSPSGKSLAEFTINSAERKERFEDIVASLCLTYLNFIFTYLPFVEQITIEIVKPKADPATGHLFDAVILQLVVNRSSFNALKLDRLDPVKAIQHLGGKCSFGPKDKDIEPILNSEDMNWIQEYLPTEADHNIYELLTKNCFSTHYLNR